MTIQHKGHKAVFSESMTWLFRAAKNQWTKWTYVALISSVKFWENFAKCENSHKPFALVPSLKSTVGFIYVSTSACCSVTPWATFSWSLFKRGECWWESNGTVCTPLLASKPLLTPINKFINLRQQAAALRHLLVTHDVSLVAYVKISRTSNLPSLDCLWISLAFRCNTWQLPL